MVLVMGAMAINSTHESDPGAQPPDLADHPAPPVGHHRRLHACFDYWLRALCVRACVRACVPGMIP
jgi:hypothetical protein